MVCPECGRPFDPDDPRTYRIGPLPEWVTRWDGPPSRVMLGLTIGLACLNLFVLSEPGGAMIALLASVVLCGGMPLVLILVILINYLTHAIATFIACRIERRLGHKRGSRRVWRWFVFPVCVLLVYAGFPTRWPLRLRFWLSRPSFERVIERALAGQPPPSGAQFVGLFYFVDVSVAANGDAWFYEGQFGPGILKQQGNAGWPPDRIAKDWYEDPEIID